jgi:hypothetical protein
LNTTIEILDVEKIGPFEFRWPEGVEYFESGWRFRIRVDERIHRARHGLGFREVYGRMRVHTVTWIDGEVQVEGVEADDYPVSQALISRLHRPGRAFARTRDEVSIGYEGFGIVGHRREIEAPYSPQLLAVKIREDDLASWVLHAWLCGQLPRKASVAAPPARAPDTSTLTPSQLPPAPSPDAQAVARALLAHGEALAGQLKVGELLRFTPNPGFSRSLTAERRA